MAEGVAAAPSRSIWSGTLTFGLVAVPVELYASVRRARIALKMLDEDGTPLSRRYYCPKEDREVDSDELVRGYEVEEDKHVVVTDEELDALLPRKSREIDLVRFVDAASIPPAYFSRPYFLAPAGDAVKAYRLLVNTMNETGLAGLATFVMREREYVVAILAEGGVLRAETLRFSEELRTPAEVGLPEPEEGPAADVKKLKAAITRLSKTKLTQKMLADEEEARLEKLVAKKAKAGEDVVEVETPEAAEAEDGDAANAPDLMELLKKSLAARK